MVKSRTKPVDFPGSCRQNEPQLRDTSVGSVLHNNDAFAAHSMHIRAVELDKIRYVLRKRKANAN